MVCFINTSYCYFLFISWINDDNLARVNNIVTKNVISCVCTILCERYRWKVFAACSKFVSRKSVKINQENLLVLSMRISYASAMRSQQWSQFKYQSHIRRWFYILYLYFCHKRHSKLRIVYLFIYFYLCFKICFRISKNLLHTSSTFSHRVFFNCKL